MTSLHNIDDMFKRLTALENEKRVSECMQRYMSLCDNLGPGFKLETLMQLFTEDAVWEGKGKRYAKTFGQHVGIDAIENMFAKYTQEPGHFSLNVHVLGNEVISVDGNTAKGSWMLLQPSDFIDGRSQLSCAHITAQFKISGRVCQISHFKTENKFSRPISEPWDNSAALPVPK
ncbi:nuclear transport factor 2 family protein [Pseudocolwellia sp. HL-MZ19]|uniref:nuclear transport factor 2 family protein n=1 Tax=Pseudocolwellia sp. HL-MZ19 TaxID=3400846 RepID=UPI003CFB9CEA